MTVRSSRKDWWGTPEPGDVRLDREGRVVKVLGRKYSPDQPRVPKGQATGGRWTSGIAQRFGNSTVGQTLEALARDFDFVLAGSAAARLHAGSKLGYDPHDLDVLELRQAREDISERWDVRKDPRNPSGVYNIVDRKTGVQVQNFIPGREVSRPVGDTGFNATFRFPYLFETDNTPQFERVAGVNVLKPDALLQTYWDGGRDELIPLFIRAMGLPRDYIDKRWYRMEFDEAEGAKYSPDQPRVPAGSPEGEKAYTDAGTYRSGIRAAVRGLWTGNLDWDQFFDAMLTTVRAGVTGAWYTGAVECGIQPGEMTGEEKLALENAIAYENQWIAGFANAIEQGSQANGGKLESLWPRSEIWIGRWEGVRDKAKVMACGDKKLEWVQGPTSDKCSSCTRLNGKVKRASYWRDKGILPRTHGAEYLECKGFRCLCTLEETDKPLSRGPLPRLP